MPAVAKKSAKVAASKSDDGVKKPKKQSLKKIQKTADILAAKKLAKLKSTKAISDKLNRAPVVKRQKAKHQFNPTRLNRGVVLIQNLPKGFLEKQLKKYFTQYGRVTRLRLARSERTGGPKGYAYIEFKYPEVAKVAAEAMNGYLMFRQRLKTVYIPPDEQDHDYFKQPVKFVKGKFGKVKLVTPKTVRAAKAVANYNKRVSEEVLENRVERSKYKLNFLQKKLAKAGINIDLSSQLYTPVEKVERVEKVEKAEKVQKVNNKVKAEKIQKVGKVQQVEKVEKKVRKNFVTPPTPEPVEKKTKKSKVTESVALAKPVKSKKKPAVTESETPKKKIRTNFVTAPTPEIVPEKKKSKPAPVSLDKSVKSKKKTGTNASSELETPKKKVRSNFVTAPTPEPIEKKKKTKPAEISTGKPIKLQKIAGTKKQTKPQKVTVSSPKNVAPKKNKQLKNKKK